MIEGGLWRHYKGGLYRVICRARDANDGVPLVIYEDIGTGRIYARPECEWEQPILERGPGVLRFVRVP
jgi:hypothetical protein